MAAFAWPASIVVFSHCLLLAQPTPPADQPVPRADRNSQIAHAQLLEKARTGRIDVYFEGDSITRRWGTSDPQYRDLLANWKQNFFGWNAANFGWGADTTQNILWRLRNGELDGVNPKIIVLLAGANNVGGSPPPGSDEAKVNDVTRGVKAILDVMREKAPDAAIVLMGITPRNDRGTEIVSTINKINDRISRFADGKRIRFVNINERLADGEGKLREGMTVDGLHLSVKGYQVWADALKPIFTELLGPPAAMDHAPPPTGDPRAQKPPAPRERNYRFDGEISRDVLENYLSRSITMTELYRSPGNLDDDIRMLKDIGAKFAGRTIYLWGREARIAEPEFLAQGREMAARIHRNDPDVVLQASVFEIVTEGVGQAPVPDWVFREFGLTPEARNFDYSKMLFPDGKMVNHWRQGSSVPDICQMESKMWFFFLAASYIDIGIEAIHVGQLDLMGRNDPENRNWDDLLKRVRRYAANKARRRYVILDAHVPKGGPVVDGRLLLDFHSFPLRPKEVAGSPQKAILEVGYSDALYGRSKGGIAPSGWKCEHLPYLVEFDNFGGTRTPGQASQTLRPSIFTWGYDEITWFAHQSEEYRNEWLRYAWRWLKEHDRDGFLEMPGGRMLTNGPEIPGEGRINWYFANTKSAACPRGFSQEETIKAIWAEDSGK